MDTNKKLTLFIALAVLGAGAAFFITKAQTKTENSILTTVNVPKLSFQAATGKKAYDTNCATCHGSNGVGSESGPPLLHNIYNPGHHSDASFYRAVKLGVQSHHWNFGNMQALPNVSEAQVRFIIRYVRELQVANGISYKKHNM
jgi:mono/diheme cytochrome c family protein